MDLNDYFNPVSLEKPKRTVLPSHQSFSRRIRIHTPDQKIGSLIDFDIALMGVPEDKNAVIRGSASSPDEVRKYLYQLSGFNKRIRILDLGNLKTTDNIADTYYAVRDTITELAQKSVLCILIGGSQDICFGVDMAMDRKDSLYNLVSLDSRLDMGFQEKKMNNDNYLDTLLKKKNPKLFHYCNIGHQSYFTPDKSIFTLEKKSFESIRLGKVRASLASMEPVFRDASFVNIDMSCIRQSDAPGVTMPSPNGFNGQELCQLSRYAGAASDLKVLGIFEMIPEKDLDGITHQLAAQAIWYFIDGFSVRKKENPMSGGATKYIVTLESAGRDITFYKSFKTDRWWMEIPAINPVTGQNYLLACNHSDYQDASTDNIPERWLKACQRLT